MCYVSSWGKALAQCIAGSLCALLPYALIAGDAALREDLHAMPQIVSNGVFSYPAPHTRVSHSDRATAVNTHQCRDPCPPQKTGKRRRSPPPPDWTAATAKTPAEIPANLQNQTDFSNLSLPFF